MESFIFWRKIEFINFHWQTRNENVIWKSRGTSNENESNESTNWTFTFYNTASKGIYWVYIKKVSCVYYQTNFAIASTWFLSRLILSFPTMLIARDLKIWKIHLLANLEKLPLYLAINSIHQRFKLKNCKTN